jgi:hypothetical protein
MLIHAGARWRTWRAQRPDLMRGVVAMCAVIAFWSAGHDCDHAGEPTSRRQPATTATSTTTPNTTR